MTSEPPIVPPTPIPQYPKVDPVTRSTAREDAFSKPGSTKPGNSKGGKWAPAKGTRFRPTNDKIKGRRRKFNDDKRRVEFF
jgi:hypothetical protein